MGDGEQSGCGQTSCFIFILTAESSTVRPSFSEDLYLFGLPGHPSQLPSLQEHLPLSPRMLVNSSVPAVPPLNPNCCLSPILYPDHRDRSQSSLYLFQLVFQYSTRASLRVSERGKGKSNFLIPQLKVARKVVASLGA